MSPIDGLPAKALTALAEIRAGLVAPRQIFWLPTALVMFHESDRSQRPCLVVGVDAARAHLVPGTTSGGGRARVVVQPGETDLPKRTWFDCSFSFPLPLLDLVTSGDAAGSLDESRWPDVLAAVDASGRPALIRVVSR